MLVVFLFFVVKKKRNCLTVVRQIFFQTNKDLFHGAQTSHGNAPK